MLLLIIRPRRLFLNSVKLGAVHKGRPQSGRFVLCGYFSDKWGGCFRCGRPHYFSHITSDFSKFIVCPHGQGRVDPGRTFCGQRGRGANFWRFYADIFLWTAP